MKIEAIKIHAQGTRKRFVTLSFNNQFYSCIRISQSLYDYLKENSIPTSQSLRRKKEKQNENTSMSNKQ